MGALDLDAVKCGWSRNVVSGDEMDERIEPISLLLSRGEWCAVVGDNGVGKSTLLHAIAGSCPFVSGNISVLGTNMEPGAIRQRFDLGVQFVPQEVACKAVWRWSDVRRFAMAKRPGLFLKEAFDNLVRECEAIGIDGTRAARIDPRIARFLIAIMSCPSVLLLDEIGTAFAGVSGGELYRVIRSIAPEAAVLFVEHDQRVAHGCADRVIEFQVADPGDGGRQLLRCREHSKEQLVEGDRHILEGRGEAFPDAGRGLPLLRMDISGREHLQLAKRASVLERALTARIVEKGPARWPQVCGEKRVEHFSGGMKVILHVLMEILCHGKIDMKESKYRHVHESNRRFLHAMASNVGS